MAELAQVLLADPAGLAHLHEQVQGCLVGCSCWRAEARAADLASPYPPAGTRGSGEPDLRLSSRPNL